MFTVAYILTQQHPHSFKKFPFLCIWNSTDRFFADFLCDGRNGFYKLRLIRAHFFSVPLRFTSNTVSLVKVCVSNLCKLTSVWGAPWRRKSYFPSFLSYFRLPFSQIHNPSVVNGLVFVMKYQGHNKYTRKLSLLLWNTFKLANSWKENTPQNWETQSGQVTWHLSLPLLPDVWHLS
jgi:hypothetical protein